GNARRSDARPRGWPPPGRTTPTSAPSSLPPHRPRQGEGAARRRLDLLEADDVRGLAAQGAADRLPLPLEPLVLPAEVERSPRVAADRQADEVVEDQDRAAAVDLQTLLRQGGIPQAGVREDGARSAAELQEGRERVAAHDTHAVGGDRRGPDSLD